jgi:hypothetical protein
MTYRGKVSRGVVILDNPAALPEGTLVEVQPTHEPGGQGSGGSQEVKDLREMLLRWAGKARGLPPDMARNHDHYIHGRPKK